MKSGLSITIAAVTLLSAGAAAQSLDRHMLSLTVGISPLGGTREGAGFLLDSRHVATNLTACCSRTTSPQVLEGKTVTGSKLVWSSKENDLAILELEQAVDAAELTLAPAKLWRQGQPVFTVQFGPAAPVTVTGQIRDLSASQPGSPRMYRTTASMLEGNAGGALFDACGSVAGVNLMTKDGRQYAYPVDSLVGGMVNLGIPARLATQTCAASGSGMGSGLLRSLLWISGILAASVLGWAGTRMALNKRPAQSGIRPHAPVPYVAPKPVLKAIAGQYMGGAFPLEAGASTLGRDPQAANLVFGAESDSISKRHCTVGWDAGRQIFVVEDLGSTNGTYLGTGERLAAHVPRELRPGERFYIGDLRNQFEVVLEV